MTFRTKASLLIGIIIAASLAVTGILYLQFLEGSLRNSISDGLTSVSNTSSQLISRFLADTLREAKAVARALPKEALEEKNPALIEERLKGFLETFPKFENGMFVLDAKGRLWADYPRHPAVRGQAFAFREYFKRTMEEQKGIIATPYRSARTGKAVLTFTALLRGRDNRVLGLLGCSVQLTSPRALEGIRLTRIGKSGYIYVYNRDRLMILHPRDERVLKKDVPVGANRLFDAAIDEGFEGMGETVNSRGIAMLLSLKQIPGTDWILGAQQPKWEAFAPINEARQRIIAGIFAAVALAVLIGAVIIRGITEPLLKLRRATMLFAAAGEGDGDAEKGRDAYKRELESISEGGEIGDLTRAFMGMSEKLDNTMLSLKNAARDWERTFDSVSDAIFILDREQRILRLNRSASHLVELEYSRAIGRPVSDLIKGIATETENSPGSGTFDPDDTVVVEVEKADDVHSFEITMTPLFGEQEKTVGTVLVAKDITFRVRAEAEAKQLEVQLQQAQKMQAIGTLAGGIAHNFNNLLMGIQGNACLARLETESSQSVYRNLEHIENLVEKGAKLTNQLLGYAREGRYEVKPLSINRLVSDMSDTFGETKKDINIHLDLAENLSGVMGDQGQIEQVLINLFVNAADAMPRGGDLFLETTNATQDDLRGSPYDVRPGNYILLKIRDTGVGMDPEITERIFDPFFTTKGLVNGTGLGLASAYGIIKTHGGHIHVESRKGQGTTFEICLPASDQKIMEEKKSPGKIIMGRETVLLVDDEDIVIDVGKRLVERLGYKVLVARGGKEAINIYREKQYKIDMVILDMVMPDMGGGETFDRLKEIDPHIRVLLSSGYSVEGQATDILKRGCDGFIQKPFTLKDLSRKLRDILEKD
jgi:PAS domain S-box-containing protein